MTSTVKERTKQKSDDDGSIKTHKDIFHKLKEMQQEQEKRYLTGYEYINRAD